MDGTRDHAFAGAGFAGDQDRGDVPGREFLGHSDHLAQSAGAANDAGEVVLLGFGFDNGSELLQPLSLGLLGALSIVGEGLLQLTTVAEPA